MGEGGSTLKVSSDDCRAAQEVDMQRNETQELDRTHTSHRQQSSMAGRRFASQTKDGEMSMEITGEKRHNVHLVKHIRATSSKCSGSYSLPETELKARVKELEKIAQFSPVLKLRVISSSTLSKGTFLTINAQGLQGSLRNERDGFSYFGCKEKAQRRPGFPEEIVNDFIIPSKDLETANRHKGQHFQIQFYIPNQCYRIKDLGVGFGAFIRLEYPLVGQFLQQTLKDNHLLNMGESFIVVNLIEEHQQGGIGGDTQSQIVAPQLRLKLFGGPATGQVFHFDCNSTDMIRIGRMSTCDIQIEDNLLSKFQAHVRFEEARGWTLIDGMESRPSTNGTWLYLNEEFEIYNGMIFKANQTLFQATIH